MANDKKTLPSTSGVDAKLGITGKTISTVTVYRAGTIEIIDILCTDAAHYYIKCSQGQVEIGGTSDWGSGTQVGGR